MCSEYIFIATKTLLPLELNAFYSRAVVLHCSTREDGSQAPIHKIHSSRCVCTKSHEALMTECTIKISNWYGPQDRLYVIQLMALWHWCGFQSGKEIESLFTKSYLEYWRCINCKWMYYFMKPRHAPWSCMMQESAKGGKRGATESWSCSIATSLKKQYVFQRA